MTLDDLRECESLNKEIDELQDKLDSIYNPVKSPNTQSIGSHGNSVSNPTEQAAFLAIQLREQLASKIHQLSMKRLETEIWLNNVDDSRVRRSVRLYYFRDPDGKKKTWKEVTKIVYGEYYSEHNARVAVERYLKKQKEQD